MQERAVIEFFHLLFSRIFFARGWTGRHEYAIKGGINLRFFFNSPRYSEDMDLDAFVYDSLVVRHVHNTFSSRLLCDRLAQEGLSANTSKASKLTTTTQRWKVGLTDTVTGATTSTKVEYSTRMQDQAGIVFDSPNKQLLQVYKISPLTLPHYDADTALLQKLNALAYRSEVQSRDVFDAAWLLTGGAQVPKIDDKTNTLALENLLALTYRDYTAQVVPYLDKTGKRLYKSKEAWDGMQHQVFEVLT